MSMSRKRMRSDDDGHGIQLKFFVNQQLVEKCDPNAMQGVYAKTLDKIFAGASKVQSQKQFVPSAINDSATDQVFDTIDDTLQEAKGCKLCWRDVDGDSKIACKNCSLRICSHCKVNCFGCNENLCTNCVKIFGCKINEDPVCEDCKFYVR